MISEATRDKILSLVNIVDIVGEAVSLKKQGSGYVGCCPFHAEKTPSLAVSPAKQIYKCFGCGAGGNAITFLQEHEHISYYEACKRLGALVNVPVDSYEPTPEEKAKYARRESLKAAIDWATAYFRSPKDQEAEAYLARRKFKPETLEAFKVGFAANDWHSLQKEAIAAGYKEEVLLDASLIGKGERGCYDYFRSRIIFPIEEVSGSVVGFTGRSVLADEKAKYLNSKDTDIFSKGKLLFGLSLAKRELVSCNECLLLEGNFDVMRFHELGFSNTVAACGTALTKEQVALIRRFTSNVTLCYDGDTAGAKASLRNAELLLSEGMNVWMVQLPEGHDPDSYGLAAGADGVAALLKTKRDFVSFRYEQLSRLGGQDAIQLAEATKELIRVVALVPDAVSREHYVRQVAKTFAIDALPIEQEVKKAIVKPIVEHADGWVGLDDEARESIRKNDKCLIAHTLEALTELRAEDKSNTIAYLGKPHYANLRELSSLTRRIELVDNHPEMANDFGKLTEVGNLCYRLLEFGFDIIVSKGEGLSDNFLSVFSADCQEMTARYEGDENLRSNLVSIAVDILCKVDETKRAIYTKRFSDALSVRESDLKGMVKPLLTVQKSKGVLKRDTNSIGERYDFDINNLPEYVDKELFYRWGYFPAEDDKGRKLFYVFRTQEGGLMMVGNFYLEPLFHVYDPDPMKNKRMVRINNAESGMTFYTEFLSDKLVEFGQFKKTLFAEGGNVFNRGNAQHHGIILASIANLFPKCYELNEFGQQHEGFYAFANAIYADGKIVHTDELGLVSHQDKTYYSPSFSKIFSDLRRGNDKYENDRWFVYKESKETSFETWARLMAEVYKLNGNGCWALLFALLSAFRSDIFHLNRLFTAPFFIGPTESGKTQVAVSIRSLFMHPEAPLFNLNSGTDAAFFSSLERYRDVAMVFEEYNDNLISDIKFQGLKAAVYDGEGKQKKKDATSKDLDISKVNCAVVLLGQESPERDDGSLANRCILLHVPKKDDWTDGERELFEDLKRREKAGLSGVLLEVLCQRDIVRKHYAKVLKEVFKELKGDLTTKGDAHQSRLLNTVSLFLAICKLWEDYIPTMRLPFSYREFYQLARAKVVSQSEAISSTNRVSVFFETLELLLNKPYGGILQGREFKIELQRSLTLQKSRNETYEHNLGHDTKVLYLRTSLVHPLYAEVRKNEALKMSNLQMYLKDHPAYIGTVKATRFEWSEFVEHTGEYDGRVAKQEKKAASITSAVALNYELLRSMAGIDLEKYENVTASEESKPFDAP